MGAKLDPFGCHIAGRNIPHAVNVIPSRDYMHTLSMQVSEPKAGGMVGNVISVVEDDVKGRIAGVIGLL